MGNPQHFPVEVVPGSTQKMRPPKCPHAKHTRCIPISVEFINAGADETLPRKHGAQAWRASMATTPKLVELDHNLLALKLYFWDSEILLCRPADNASGRIEARRTAWAHEGRCGFGFGEVSENAG